MVTFSMAFEKLKRTFESFDDPQILHMVSTRIDYQTNSDHTVLSLLLEFLLGVPDVMHACPEAAFLSVLL